MAKYRRPQSFGNQPAGHPDARSVRRRRCHAPHRVANDVDNEQRTRLVDRNAA